MPQEYATSYKPLQRKSWAEKNENDQQWFKDTSNYFIGVAGPGDTFGNKRTNFEQAYNIYNNRIPEDWLAHVTNPLSSKKKLTYGAKMRPTGILRTNLDLLIGEYPRRPFVFQVMNMGEDGYNKYLDNLNKGLQNNLTQHFIAQAQMEAEAQGIPVEQQEQPDQIELPETFQQKFKSSYKDNQAISGQKWLKRAIREFYMRPEQFKMFKDYLVSGYTSSYKGVERSTLQYKRISPDELFYDLYDGNEYVEDKEWVVRMFRMNYSDIVDEFYDELTEKQHSQLENAVLPSPDSLYSSLRGSSKLGSNLQWVYHTTWKTKVENAILYYADELTGEPQSMLVDGDYKVDPSKGEYMEKFWANQWYETTRVGADNYLRMRPIPIQRNEMNNFSRCKGPYNGRAFSAVNSANISVLDIGLPFQLMHMVTQYAIEKTINKNKGKIAIMDKNAIPRTGDWNEEKWMYYADGMGYAFMDRNQEGADKGMNQYHVMDMSLYDSLQQLIALQDKIKQQWDDILGITRQRKGQTYASDAVSNNEAATFQSTIITDVIFAGFDEFVERDYQGILDMSRFTNVDGVRKIYNNDDFTTELLEIQGEGYTNSDLGLFFVQSPKEQERFEQFKSQLQAMVQNGVKGSTIIDILTTDSIAELKQKLLRIEEIEAQVAQQTEQAKAEQQGQAEEHAIQLEEWKNQLKIIFENAVWDRKDENEEIKGQFSIAVAEVGAGAGETGDGMVVNDTGAVDKAVNERIKIIEDRQQKRREDVTKQIMQMKDLVFKYDELHAKERMNKDNNRTVLKNKVSGQK